VVKRITDEFAQGWDPDECDEAALRQDEAALPKQGEGPADGLAR